jgi:hypothetical protein
VALPGVGDAEGALFLDHFPTFYVTPDVPV